MRSKVAAGIKGARQQSSSRGGARARCVTWPRWVVEWEGAGGVSHGNRISLWRGYVPINQVRVLKRWEKALSGNIKSKEGKGEKRRQESMGGGTLSTF